jgi:hypothetical protein
MEKPIVAIETLFEKVDAYSKISVELAKLKLLHFSTVAATSLLSRLGVIMMFIMFALAFNIGLALLLGELLGKAYYGFFIVALFYLLVGVVLHFFLHTWIRKPVSELIINGAA